MKIQTFDLPFRSMADDGQFEIQNSVFENSRRIISSGDAENPMIKVDCKFPGLLDPIVAFEFAELRETRRNLIEIFLAGLFPKFGAAFFKKLGEKIVVRIAGHDGAGGLIGINGAGGRKGSEGVSQASADQENG